MGPGSIQMTKKTHKNAQKGGSTGGGETKHILSATFPQNLRKATEFLGLERGAKKCLLLPLIKTTASPEVSMILSRGKDWEGIFKPANLDTGKYTGFSKRGLSIQSPSATFACGLNFVKLKMNNRDN